MPLIDVTVSPAYVSSRVEGGGAAAFSRQFIRKEFGLQLPELFARSCERFGMGPGLSSNDVQVQFHDFGEDDLNTPDLWVKVQLGEKPPAVDDRRMVRNAIYNELVRALRTLGTEPPANFVLDVLWGPTSGRGTVNGEPIEL
jgi:hypothetical protein